eukprot:g13856.t1
MLSGPRLLLLVLVLPQLLAPGVCILLTRKCDDACGPCQSVVTRMGDKKQCRMCHDCMNSGIAVQHGPPACVEECGPCEPHREEVADTCQKCHDCKHGSL